MELIRGVVFDLDDTLYLEREYVLSGFRSVAESIADASLPADEMYQFLERDFASGVRGDAFDRMLAAFPALAARRTAAELTQLYRAHSPRIGLESSRSRLLDVLGRHGIKLGLITDGPVASQSGKIAALGLSGYFDPMILTDAWGVEFRKPHPRAFEAVMRQWSLEPEQLVYAGDNPLKDFHAPRALGWQTVRLRIEGQLHQHAEPTAIEYAAAQECASFADLARWLLSACGIPSD